MKKDQECAASSNIQKVYCYHKFHVCKLIGQEENSHVV
jgi:hypothetical protein